MTLNRELQSAGLHRRGRFGQLHGVEVQIISTLRAGTFDSPVDAATLPRESVPADIAEVPLSRPASHEFIVVALSELTDLIVWDWYVQFQGAWFRVENERDGQFLIWTKSNDRAKADPGWQGEYYNGWDRWIDIEGSEVTVISYPHGEMPIVADGELPQTSAQSESGKSGDHS